MIVSPRAKKVQQIYLWKNSEFVEVDECFLYRRIGNSQEYRKVYYFRRKGYQPPVEDFAVINISGHLSAQLSLTTGTVVPPEPPPEQSLNWNTATEMLHWNENDSPIIWQTL